MYDRSIMWLNETGDITLSWSKDRDEIMKKIIQQKMDEGYSFFIVKRGMVNTSYTKVDSVDQIKKCNINMTDKEAELMIAGDGVALSSLAAGTVETIGRAKTADEVVKKNTVAVRPLRGG